MIFSNARLIFPDGIRDGLELIVEIGKIAEIRQRSVAESTDLGGNYLAPGFVDLHIHGALGRDTMEGTAEAFGQICSYHASGGTTSLLLTTVTAPIADIVEVLRAACAARNDLKQIAGVHVEGPFISKNRAGAQRIEFIRDPQPHVVDQLLAFADIIRIVTLAPELPGALALIDRLRMHKIIASGGHSDASDLEARAGFEYGMGHVTHTFNAMSSAHRIDLVLPARLRRHVPDWREAAVGRAALRPDVGEFSFLP